MSTSPVNSGNSPRTETPQANPANRSENADPRFSAMELSSAPATPQESTAKKIAETQSQLGRYYVKTEDWPRAISHCKKALEADKNAKYAHYGLGYALFYQSDFLKECDYLQIIENLIKVEPDKLEYNSAQLLLGRSYITIGDYGKAMRCLQIVVNFPHHSQDEYERITFAAHYFLGICYGKQGKDAEAIAEFSKVTHFSRYYIPAQKQIGKLKT